MHSLSQKNLVLHLQSKTTCQPELLSHMHQHAGGDAHHVSPNLEVELDSISRDTTCDGAGTTSDASLQSNYLKLARSVAENVLKGTFAKLPFEKMFGTNLARYCLNFTVCVKKTTILFHRPKLSSFIDNFHEMNEGPDSDFHALRNYQVYVTVSDNHSKYEANSNIHWLEGKAQTGKV